jgi:hypothetical protein
VLINCPQGKWSITLLPEQRFGSLIALGRNVDSELQNLQVRE